MKNSQLKTLKFKNGNIYQGEVKNGKMHGKGTLNLKDGRIVEGDFKEGKLHGIITISKDDISYSCQFIEGKKVIEEDKKDDKQLSTFYFLCI